MKSVCFLMSGTAHLPYLVVSLYSLRRFWSGKIEVHAWPESFDLAQAIGQDPRLDAEVILREPTYRGRNCQFFDKIKLMRTLDSKSPHLYLDADTKVCGKLDELLDRARVGFCATQFCNWHSNEGAPRNRIHALLGRESITQSSVEICLKYPMPSLNGGVFAAMPNCQPLKVWEEWTQAVLDIFIADETVLHPLQVEFSTLGSFDVALGGKWNCSPKYQPSYLHDDDVVIRHFHGDSCCRLQKSQKGVDQWYPMYRRCLEYDIGSMKQWIGFINNKHLTALEKHYADLKTAGVGTSAG